MCPSADDTVTDRRRGSTVSTIAAAWILSIGVDVLLHGGILARQYLVPSPFLLNPPEAFRRIPYGYLAFLMLTAALYWLIRRLDVRGANAGFRYAATAGFVVWGAVVIGLYSISTAAVSLLAGWWLGHTIELGLAGAVIGASAAGTRHRRLWAPVALAVTGCVVATVALQAIGWAPVVKMN